MQLRRVALVRDGDRANPEHVGDTWKQRTDRSLGQCCPEKVSAVAAVWRQPHSTPQTALYPNCPSSCRLLNTDPAPKNHSSPRNRLMNHSILSLPFLKAWYQVHTITIMGRRHSNKQSYTLLDVFCCQILETNLLKHLFYHNSASDEWGIMWSAC